jgi:hypothetical protein
MKDMARQPRMQSSSPAGEKGVAAGLCVWGGGGAPVTVFHFFRVSAAAGAFLVYCVEVFTETRARV